MSNNENSKLVVVQNFIDGQFEASDTYLDSLEPGNGRHSVQINEKNITKKYLHNLLIGKENKHSCRFNCCERNDKSLRTI